MHSEIAGTIENIGTVQPVLLGAPQLYVSYNSAGRSSQPLPSRPAPFVSSRGNPSGCIVSMLAVTTTVACNKSEEDVAVIIGLIGAVLGERMATKCWFFFLLEMGLYLSRLCVLFASCRAGKTTV